MFKVGMTKDLILIFLLCRGHYSIDVLVAYWVSSRLWWIYHTLATQAALKEEENSLSGAWWWHIFLYFEKNVPCDLAHSYSLPVPRGVLLMVETCRERGGRGSGEGQEARGQQVESGLMV